MPPRSVKRRAPRRLWPALWCVAALRLLVPVRFTGAWALWPSHAGAGLGGGQAAQAAPALPWAQLWLAGACALGIYFSGSVCGGALAAAKRRALCLRAGAGLFSGVAGAPPASG